MTEATEVHAYRIAEYNALRAEILESMRTMRVLVTANLTSFGVLVAVAFNPTHKVPHFLLVSAGLSGLFAIVMAMVHVHVGRLGDYIRTEIEKPSGVMNWEAAIRKPRWRTLYWWSVVGMFAFAGVPLGLYVMASWLPG